MEGTFLMSFTLMGRPYPVTQHPEDVESGLKGRACREEPHRCCGPDSHDSHYVTVRKKGEYYPCPPREQPISTALSTPSLSRRARRSARLE